MKCTIRQGDSGDFFSSIPWKSKKINQEGGVEKMNRKDYIREQIRKGKQLVTGAGGNDVRPEREAPNSGAKIDKHDWGV